MYKEDLAVGIWLIWHKTQPNQTLIVSKKDAEDKETKTWWRDDYDVRLFMKGKSGKEKSDTWSQKNSPHFITDVKISLWLDLKKRSGIFKLSRKDLFFVKS